MNARQRREAEFAASADKQHQLKREAAARRAARAERPADENRRSAGVDSGASPEKPDQPG